MKEFTLSRDEINCLKNIAHWRCKGKVNIVTDFNRTLGDYDGTFEAHFLGVVGEYIVSKHLNGFFDFMPSIIGDKHKADIIVGIHGDVRIAVKTTKYDPPILKVNHMQEIEDCTHLALCHYKEPKATIHWVKSKNYFLKHKFKQDFGYGERMCLGV